MVHVRTRWQPWSQLSHSFKIKSTPKNAYYSFLFEIKCQFKMVNSIWSVVILIRCKIFDDYFWRKKIKVNIYCTWMQIAISFVIKGTNILCVLNCVSKPFFAENAWLKCLSVLKLYFTFATSVNCKRVHKQFVSCLPKTRQGIKHDPDMTDTWNFDRNFEKKEPKIMSCGGGFYLWIISFFDPNEQIK